MRIYFFILLISVSFVSMNAQTREQVMHEADSTYKVNITKTRLNGVYIPKDIPDAMLELDRLSPSDAVQKFKSAPEDVVAKKLHFGLGRWMSVNWSFVPGSRFSKVLNELGLIYEEEKINFVLRMYHRHLNGNNLLIKNTAAEYVKKREDNYRILMKEKYGIDSVVIKKGF